MRVKRLREIKRKKKIECGQYNQSLPEMIKHKKPRRSMPKLLQKTVFRWYETEECMDKLISV